jgi:parallel beta-helix repeat protein
MPRPAFIALAVVLLGGVSACGEDDNAAALCEGVAAPCVAFSARSYSQDAVQRALVTAEPDTTFVFGAGTFRFDRELSLDAPGTTIRGAGIDQTILDFGAQQTGNGIFVEAPGDRFLIEDLTIRDTRQNGIEVRGTRGIVFRRIGVEWTADPREFDPDRIEGEDAVDASRHSPFGRYGIYPTQCEQLLVERIRVKRASDAGVYVGSCNDAVLRYSLAEENVTGFQVENTKRADVYGNTSRDNSLGVLIHDLPAQPINANGDHTRVFDNDIVANNFVNFSLPQDLTTNIPVGTGMIVLARDNVEISGNRFADNDTAHVAIVSFYMLGKEFTRDNGYDPYPSRVQVRSNAFAGGGAKPEFIRRGRAIEMGFFLQLMRERDGFDGRVPDVVYDGIVDPEQAASAPDEDRENPARICIGTSPTGSFVNLRAKLEHLEGPDLDALLANVSRDVEPFRCEEETRLSEVTLDLWPGAGYVPDAVR